MKFHCLLPSNEQIPDQQEEEEPPVSSRDVEVGKETRVSSDPFSHNAQLQAEMRQHQEDLTMKMRQMVERIGKACVVRNEGWWSYEFCPSGSVRQYHEDRQSGAIEANIGLGYAPSQREWR